LDASDSIQLIYGKEQGARCQKAAENYEEKLKRGMETLKSWQCTGAENTSIF